MSPVAENVIPVPEVVEHFGDAQAVIARLMKSADQSRDRVNKCLAAVDELRALHVRCVSASWEFAESNRRKSSAYCAALEKLDDAISAQFTTWARARTLRLAALVAIKAADAL